MKPRADDEDYWPMYLGVGNAHKVDDADEQPDKPAGRLIVPDPEQRHGWREHYVKPAARVSQSSRPLGFRRP